MIFFFLIVECKIILNNYLNSLDVQQVFESTLQLQIPYHIPVCIFNAFHTCTNVDVQKASTIRPLLHTGDSTKDNRSNVRWL